MAEKARQYPLKKQELSQPRHYIRYFSNKEGDPETNYNYEATLQDLEFLRTLEAPSCTEAEFEQLVDMFERENWLQTCMAQHKVEGGEGDEVKPLYTFAEAWERLNLQLPMGHHIKVYEAR